MLYVFWAGHFSQFRKTGIRIYVILMSLRFSNDFLSCLSLPIYIYISGTTPTAKYRQDMGPIQRSMMLCMILFLLTMTQIAFIRYNVPLQIENTIQDVRAWVIPGATPAYSSFLDNYEGLTAAVRQQERTRLKQHVVVVNRKHRNDNGNFNNNRKEPQTSVLMKF